MSAASLDDLYYEYTDFDPKGPEAQSFRELLDHCEKVIDARPYTTTNKKTKVTKRDLFAIALLVQDLMQGGVVSMNQALPEVARVTWQVAPLESLPARAGKVVSATAITEYYEWFIRARVAQAKLVGLDPKREFDEDQKDAIWNAAEGVCAVCQRPIDREADLYEFDHRTPWILGGRTVIENGRPVHAACHLRGRAVLQTLGQK